MARRARAPSRGSQEWHRSRQARRSSVRRNPKAPHLKPYSFHDDAEDELQAAATWDELQLPDLGRDFLNKVEQAIRLIGQSPEIGAPHGPEVRAVVVRRFPYVLYYADSNERIWILAVAHAKRRPGYWRRRKPE